MELTVSKVVERLTKHKIAYQVEGRPVVPLNDINFCFTFITLFVGGAEQASQCKLSSAVPVCVAPYRKRHAQEDDAYGHGRLYRR